jgi:NADH-quinone oxidoreductase subunit H
MMLMAEYFHLVIGSLLMVTLFWGGWHLPWVGEIGNPVLAAVVKLLILVGKMGLFVLVALIVRWTIPRFRFDQLMNLAWKVMIPLALLNLICVMVVKQLDVPLVFLTATSVLLFLGAGWVAVKTRGTVTNPKRPVRKLPPGVPAGVTYAGR